MAVGLQSCTILKNPYQIRILKACPLRALFLKIPSLILSKIITLASTDIPIVRIIPAIPGSVSTALNDAKMALADEQNSFDLFLRSNTKDLSFIKASKAKLTKKLKLHYKKRLNFLKMKNNIPIETEARIPGILIPKPKKNRRFHKKSKYEKSWGNLEKYPDFSRYFKKFRNKICGFLHLMRIR